MAKDISEQGRMLLGFISRRFDETQRPVRHDDMVDSGPIARRSLTTVRAALMGKGLLRVTTPGKPFWLPADAAYVPTEEET